MDPHQHAKKKKPNTVGYKTSPPQNRGKKPKPPDDKELKEATQTYAAIAALASSYVLVNPHIVKQKNKCQITEISVTLASDPTKRKYLAWATQALKEWRDQGSIPEKAIQHLEHNYPSVWPSIPFVSRILQQRRQQQLSNAEEEGATEAGAAGTPATCVAGGPTYQDATAPGCSRTVTTDEQEITFPADLFEEDSDMWVDVDLLQANRAEPDDGETMSEEDEGQQVLEFLDKATISFLHGTNRRKEAVSWERIMKYWFTYANVSLEYIDKVLRWIKTHNAVLTEDQIHKLPKTGKTFLKITDDERKTVHAIKTRDASGKQIGLYMHYGLMSGIFGTSPGTD